MISRASRRIVGIVAMVSLVGVPAASAQNTLTGSSYGYMVGQGPINIYIGNTGGADTERWYTTALVQGKSYCLETFRGNSEYNIDNDLTIQLIRASDSTVLNTFNYVAGDPDLGSNSRWTRGCLIAAVTQQYYVRLFKTGCCPARTGNVQFRIVDTTLHAPWWFVNSGQAYDAFIELANTTTIAVSATVTVRSPAGTVVGTQTASVPAGGNMAVSVASLGASGSGSAQIAHNGPPGAIVGNITTLSAASGLSFDSPFDMRQGFK